MYSKFISFICELIVLTCYKVGANSINTASFHYMYEPKMPKSLNNYKEWRDDNEKN